MAVRSKVFTYQAELHWQGGQAAAIASGDRPELPIGPPPDFPGGAGDRWSPAPGHAEAVRRLTGKGERDCFITASTTAHIENDWRIVE